MILKAKKAKRIRTFGRFLFVVYILFLLYFLIFSDWYGRSGVMENYHYNLSPFHEIKRFWEYRDQLGIWSIINLVGNVLIFVPFGFFKALGSEKRRFFITLIDGIFLSMVVETFQFVSKVGRFDVDDLILNAFGVIMGYLIFVVCNATRRNYGTKRKRS